MAALTCPCGAEFVATSPRARYCSDKCRKRSKRSGADVVELPTTPTQEPSEAPRLGPIATAAARELSEAGRLDSALGQTALALACRLDGGRMETGAAYASLSKEFEAKLAAATRGGGAASSPLQLQDELASRRAAHGA
jgi:hypothetical protein